MVGWCPTTDASPQQNYLFRAQDFQLHFCQGKGETHIDAESSSAFSPFLQLHSLQIRQHQVLLITQRKRSHSSVISQLLHGFAPRSSEANLAQLQQITCSRFPKEIHLTKLSRGATLQ